MKLRFWRILGIICIFYSLTCSNILNDGKCEVRKANYQAAILMEAETRQILFEKDAHKNWPPASLAKMMLILIIIEKVDAGEIKLTDSVNVSADASRIGGSQVYLKQGEVFPLEEMMKAVAIVSANDACHAVAEYMSGSVEGFVEMMNERAKELKMTDTYYYNVHGLPPSQGQGEDTTSAYDCAILACELLKHPKVLEWTSTQQTTFRNGKLVMNNTNALLKSFRGADGLKTGSYSSAGFNMVVTAEREGTRFISVVLGAPTSKIRFAEAGQLLSNGFNIYQKRVLLKKGDVASQEVTIIDGKVKKIKPVAASDLIVFVKRVSRSPELSEGEADGITVQFNGVSEMKAPVPKGASFGSIAAKLGDKTLYAVDAIANEDVKKADFWWKLFHWK
jgi:D-alanyl-D-alanine carboxypeptidase (penicillin-binding protein 5/6)